MDGTPLSNDTGDTTDNSNNVRNNASPARHRAANDGAQESNTGPFIVGSPIDLGDIDNVDNIGLRLDPVTRGRRRTREHIELQETGAPESTSIEGESREFIGRSRKLR